NSMSHSVNTLEAFDTTEPYDVCVIGTGIAGSILGLRLVQAGLRVLLLEAPAPRHTLFDGGKSGACSYEVSGDTGYPLRLSGAHSGSAWSGICERFDPSDFQVQAY